MRALVKGDPKRRTGQAGKNSPFVPGQGVVPPYLAGRETEQALIRKLLSKLEEQQAPGSDILIYGPRGNGKTALMAWALREARDRGIGTLKFRSADIDSKEWLARQLSIVPPWMPLLSNVTFLGIGIKTRDSPAGILSSALARRTRRRALVVAVDEAHTLGIDAGRALLNAFEESRSEQVPAMLILAGTPDLPRHLGRMEASFWGRSTRLPLELLHPDAAAEAIRIPMAEEGRSILDDALARVVAESHGYPFFLQVWGDLLWDQMSVTAHSASLHDVDRATPRFERIRNVYYSDRHDELAKAKLALVAAKLSTMFVDADKRTRREVDETIRLALESEGRASDSDAVMAACDRLYDLGYIWSPGVESRRYFRPGIPSLMQYVARSEDVDLGA